MWAVFACGGIMALWQKVDTMAPQASKKRKTKPKKRKDGERMDRKSMQLVFLNEFLVSRNATEAALKAGCSPGSAASQASRWLKLPHIQDEIRKADAKLADQTGDLRQKVVQELIKLAFFDTRKLYEADGSVKLVKDWDDDTAAAVASFDVAEIFAGRGEQKMAIGLSKRVGTRSKEKALELLMKHLGMFAPEKVAQTTPTGEALPPPVPMASLPTELLEQVVEHLRAAPKPGE